MGRCTAHRRYPKPLAIAPRVLFCGCDRPLKRLGLCTLSVAKFLSRRREDGRFLPGKYPLQLRRIFVHTRPHPVVRSCVPQHQLYVLAKGAARGVHALLDLRPDSFEIDGGRYHLAVPRGLSIGGDDQKRFAAFSRARVTGNGVLLERVVDVLPGFTYFTRGETQTNKNRATKIRI